MTTLFLQINTSSYIELHISIIQLLFTFYQTICPLVVSWLVCARQLFPSMTKENARKSSLTANTAPCVAFSCTCERCDVDVMTASMAAPKLGNWFSGICRIFDMKSTTTCVTRFVSKHHCVGSSLDSTSPTKGDLLT